MICHGSIKFLNCLDAKNLCCNPPKIQRDQTLGYFIKMMQINGVANSEDPDQTRSDLGLHCLPRLICPKKKWVIMVCFK